MNSATDATRRAPVEGGVVTRGRMVTRCAEQTDSTDDVVSTTVPRRDDPPRDDLEIGAHVLEPERLVDVLPYEEKGRQSLDCRP
jgi:hypothetical protein